MKIYEHQFPIKHEGRELNEKCFQQHALAIALIPVILNFKRFSIRIKGTYRKCGLSDVTFWLEILIKFYTWIACFDWGLFINDVMYFQWRLLWIDPYQTAKMINNVQFSIEKVPTGQRNITKGDKKWKLSRVSRIPRRRFSCAHCCCRFSVLCLAFFLSFHFIGRDGLNWKIIKILSVKRVGNKNNQTPLIFQFDF